MAKMLRTGSAHSLVKAKRKGRELEFGDWVGRCDLSELVAWIIAAHFRTVRVVTTCVGQEEWSVIKRQLWHAGIRCVVARPDVAVSEMADLIVMHKRYKSIVFRYLRAPQTIVVGEFEGN